MNLPKHLHLFQTEEEHDEIYNSDSAYTEPWVALTEENDIVTYNKLLFTPTIQMLKSFDRYDEQNTFVYKPDEYGYSVNFYVGGLRDNFSYSERNGENYLDASCYLDTLEFSTNGIEKAQATIGISERGSITTSLVNSTMDFVTIIDDELDTYMRNKHITATTVNVELTGENAQMAARIDGNWFLLNPEIVASESSEIPFFMIDNFQYANGTRPDNPTNKTMPEKVEKIDIDVIDHIWQYIDPADAENFITSLGSFQNVTRSDNYGLAICDASLKEGKVMPCTLSITEQSDKVIWNLQFVEEFNHLINISNESQRYKRNHDLYVNGELVAQHTSGNVLGIYSYMDTESQEPQIKWAFYYYLV